MRVSRGGGVEGWRRGWGVEGWRRRGVGASRGGGVEGWGRRGMRRGVVFQENIRLLRPGCRHVQLGINFFFVDIWPTYGGCPPTACHGLGIIPVWSSLVDKSGPGLQSRRGDHKRRSTRAS